VEFWEVFLLLLIWIPLLILWIFALTDLARRHDISGLAKGLWAVAIVLLPVIGMIIYFITRPHDDEVQNFAKAPATAGTTNPGAIDHATITQLEKLADLRDAGAITEEDFASMKAKLLS
jgi:hypothetical protein